MVGERNLIYRLARFFIHLLLILAALATLLPFVHLLSLSLSGRAAVQAGAVGIWPVQFTLGNYVYVSRDNLYLRAMMISAARVLLGVMLCLFVVVLTAYPLSQDRLHMPGRTVFKMLLLFGMLFTGGLIPYYLSMRNLGLIDNFAVLIVPQALNIFYVIVMINFFRGIPSELAEAAVIDGASHPQVLWYVYLPVSLPALATIALFSAVQHWNSWFDGILFLTKATMWPVQSLTYQRITLRQIEYIATSGHAWTDVSQITAEGLSAAFVMLVSVPIMLVYPFLQRYFITGLTLGSVKG